MSYLAKLEKNRTNLHKQWKMEWVNNRSEEKNLSEQRAAEKIIGVVHGKIVTGEALQVLINNAKAINSREYEVAFDKEYYRLINALLTGVKQK